MQYPHPLIGGGLTHPWHDAWSLPQKYHSLGHRQWWLLDDIVATTLVIFVIVVILFATYVPWWNLHLKCNNPLATANRPPECTCFRAGGGNLALYFHLLANILFVPTTHHTILHHITPSPPRQTLSSNFLTNIHHPHGSVYPSCKWIIWAFDISMSRTIMTVATTTIAPEIQNNDNVRDDNDVSRPLS